MIKQQFLGHPTFVSADLGLLGFFFLSFFFFRYVPSELAERNSTKIGHMVESKCDLKTHLQNMRYLFLLQQLHGVSYTASKQHEIWSTNDLKLEVHLPTLQKFCIPLYCQASQMELNQTLPNGGRSIALTVCRRKVGVIPSEKIGAKNFNICSVFRRFET